MPLASSLGVVAARTLCEPAIGDEPSSHEFEPWLFPPLTGTSIPRDVLETRAQHSNKIMESRGYEVVTRFGQRTSTSTSARRVEGPDNNQTEVYVNKIPRQMLEADLLPYLQRAGPVYIIRFMLDFSCFNRGFCFVKYYTMADAARACELIKNLRVHPDFSTGIVATPSFNNCCLFFYNLPPQCTAELLHKELKNNVEGVVKVKMLPTSEPLERRSAHVTFVNHTAATQARRILIPGCVQLLGYQIDIDWAKPPVTELEKRANAAQSQHFKEPQLTARTLHVPTSGHGAAPDAMRTSPDASDLSSHLLSQQPIANQARGLGEYSADLDSGFGSSSDSLSPTLSLLSVNPGNPDSAQVPLVPASPFNSFAAAAPINQPASFHYDRSFLGWNTVQMLGNCLSPSGLDLSNVITVSNLDCKKATLSELKQVFQLGGLVTITEMKPLSADTINITYETSQQADLMIEAFIRIPDTFKRFALENHRLLILGGGSRATRDPALARNISLSASKRMSF